MQTGIFAVRIITFCASMCACVAKSYQFMKYNIFYPVHLVSQQKLDPFYQRFILSGPWL